MDTTLRETERMARAGDPQAQEKLDVMEARLEDAPTVIVIDGEALEVNSTRAIGYGDLWELDTDDGDYIVSADAETAGAAARERWQEMAENDPAEFTCMVGEATLIAWGLGQSAGPGMVHVNSLTEWLDLTATVPEEEWASYDSAECDVEGVTEDIEDELGYVPTVAYRCN